MDENKTAINDSTYMENHDPGPEFCSCPCALCSGSFEPGFRITGMKLRPSHRINQFFEEPHGNMSLFEMEGEEQKLDLREEGFLVFEDLV
jgi:hypothetical protein